MTKGDARRARKAGNKPTATLINRIVTAPMAQIAPLTFS